MIACAQFVLNDEAKGTGSTCGIHILDGVHDLVDQRHKEFFEWNMASHTNIKKTFKYIPCLFCPKTLYWRN